MFEQKQKQLASYLAAGLGAGCLTSTSTAAIVNFGPSHLLSFNSVGITPGTSADLWLLPGNKLYAFNTPDDVIGLIADFSGPLNLAMASASPGYGLFKFTSGSSIGPGGNWNSDDDFTSYFFNLNLGWQSAPWEAGSFLGFQANSDTTPIYGWLEVTWNGTDKFEILGGAYEDSGAPIVAGAVAPIPEPASVLGTIGLLSAGMFVRRRRLAA